MIGIIEQMKYKLINSRINLREIDRYLFNESNIESSTVTTNEIIESLSRYWSNLSMFLSDVFGLTNL
jgi:hypothetical protein